MKLVFFTSSAGLEIAIPADKITGFCKANTSFGETFIATGPDGVDGAENGWYVAESFNTVKVILQSV